MGLVFRYIGIMVKITVTYEGNLRTAAVHEESGSVIKTDAPKDNHGRGEFFSPTDLLAAALGTCVVTIMGILANKLKVDLKGLRATVEKEMAKMPSRKVGKIIIHIFCPSTFDPETTSKLEQAGIGCPVHHSLHPDVQQEIIFHWGEA
jgi:putative redox protein